MSKEYGWTDDQILDLTVRRFRQIVAAIQRRNFMKRREEIALISWQTRQLASFVAGGYMIDGKHGNPALDAAQILAYDEIERAQIEEASIASSRGGDLIYAKDEEGNAVLDEHGRLVVEEIVTDLSNMNNELSVMSAFGDPSKWRGRG